MMKLIEISGFGMVTAGVLTGIADESKDNRSSDGQQYWWQESRDALRIES